MLVIDDLCGDEDDAYLWCEYFKLYIHDKFMDMIKKPISYDEALEHTGNVVKKILIDNVDIPKYAPQVKCTLSENGIINTTFFVPQWLADIADRINKDDL